MLDDDGNIVTSHSLKQVPLHIKYARKVHFMGETFGHCAYHADSDESSRACGDDR